MIELKTKVSRQLTGETVRDRGRERAIIVTLYPGDLIGFRLKGTRKEYQTSLRRCYDVAVLQEAERLRAEKKSNRKRTVKRGLVG